MKISNLYFFLSVPALSAACVSPQIAVNPRADFSAVKRVAVLTFNGPRGDLAADLLTQNLVAYGAEVIERQRINSVIEEQRLSSSMFDPAAAKRLGKILGVDALFFGTVAESNPAKTYLVSASDKNVVTNVTQLAGGNVYAGGSVPGVPNSQLLSTAAEVSMVTRMVDVETGSILWSASMNYEGFDIHSAMNSITKAFVISLSPIWSGLTAR